jgi:hypothetical protein
MIFQFLPIKALDSDKEMSVGSNDLTGEIAIHFPINQSCLIRDFSGNAGNNN